MESFPLFLFGLIEHLRRLLHCIGIIFPYPSLYYKNYSLQRILKDPLDYSGKELAAIYVNPVKPLFS